MNKYVKAFLHRGMLFGGFGPIVAGVVYAALGACIPDFSLNGAEVLIAIVSLYLLAFLQAGASVFNQIENWPIAKSLFFHFLTIYVAYVGCYLLNSWIPFEPMAVLFFTALFAALYIVIWLTVYFIVKSNAKKLNATL